MKKIILSTGNVGKVKEFKIYRTCEMKMLESDFDKAVKQLIRKSGAER